MNLKNIYVVNHTHWDREWYETVEQYRVKLKQGVLHVLRQLEKGDLENFFFDGQTIVVEDVKKVLSDADFERFEKAILDGKIEIGPWYILPDGFLIDEESYMENLNQGMKIAKRYNSKHNIGYLPDTFGHISQIPQILSSLDIDYALIHRGANSETVETTWTGADGSNVKTVVLPLMEGYYQPFFHAEGEDFDKLFLSHVERTMPFQNSDTLLILNGCDHTFPPHNMQEKMTRIQALYPGAEVKQTLLSTFLSQLDIETSDALHGEQRNVGKAYVLPGVLSARVYLKQQNRTVVDTLTGQVEPVLTMLQRFQENEKYCSYFWKQALQNHPHDSICGCSIDEVHDEMEIRSMKITKGSQQLMKETIEEHLPFRYSEFQPIFNNKLTVFHPLPIAQQQTIEHCIMIPAKLEHAMDGITLWHGEKEIPFELLEVKKEEAFLRTICTPPSYADYVMYTVRFALQFNGIESKTIDIKLSTGKNVPTVKEVAKQSIENEAFCLAFENGKLTLLRKRDGWKCTDFFTIDSSLDAGDTYNYSPPVDNAFTVAQIKGVTVYVGTMSEEMHVSFEWKAPVSLNETRTGACDQSVLQKATATFTMVQGHAEVKVVWTVENAAKDCKMRVGMKNIGETVLADTAFDWIERSEKESNYEVAPLKETDYNQYPSLRHVYAPAVGIQWTHDGTQEVEISDDAFYVTMLRGVGMLSRRDLRARGGGAGPGFATPKAQCLGTWHYTAVIADAQFGNPNKHYQLLSPLTAQSTESIEIEGLALSNAKIGVSRCVAVGNKVQLRLYNPFSTEQATSITIKQQTVAEVLLRPKQFTTVEV
ncbi:MAG: hypothetical protein ACRCWQ_09540 [Bacilli bacterium]